MPSNIKLSSSTFYIRIIILFINILTECVHTLCGFNFFFIKVFVFIKMHETKKL